MTKARIFLLGTAKIAIAGVALHGPQLLAQAVDGGRAANQIEDIVVTARKREESVQSAPLSITAFTQQTFDRQQVAGLKDLHLSIPNVTIVASTTTSNSAQIFIRGIGRDESTWNVESGVAVYMDGVYLPQQTGALMDLIEFERIEVLRGPQGTLYGRNATGGAVNFVAKRPEFEDLTLKADLTVGSYDRFDTRLAIGTQIVPDVLAVRLDAVSRTESGFVRRANSDERLNGTSRQTGRLSLLWRARDNVDVYFAADLQHDRSGQQTPTPIRDPQTGAIVVLPNAKVIPGVLPSGGFLASPAYGSRYIADPSGPNVNEFDGFGLTGHVAVDLGWADFKSITGYRGFRFKLFGDLDGSRNFAIDFQQDIRQRQFSQEIQLVSSGDNALGYVLGAYYFNENIQPDANNIFVGFTTSAEQKTDSFAAFGELSYRILPELSATVGGRITHDRKHVVQSGFRTATGGDSYAVDVSESWTKFSPKVLINYQPADNVLLYASYSQGFKAGGVVDGRPTNPISASTFFEPETVDSYEIGMKSDLLDNRLRLNLSAFSSTYSDIQLSFLNPLTNSIQVVNADGRLRGFEAEVSGNPVDGLYLYGIAGYLDDKYTDVPLNPVTGLPAVAGLTLDARFKHAPEFHYKLGFDYRFALNSGSVGVGANWMHTSKIYRNVANTEQGATQPYGTLDAQLYYETNDARWRVTLAGQNLTDAEYWTQSLSTFARYYAKPATWSLAVRFAY